MSLQLQENLIVTLSVTDPRLTDEEREALAQRIYRQMGDARDELGHVRRERVAAPEGAKSASATMAGVLTAILSATTLKAFFAYLSERLRGHEVTLEMEVSSTGGKKQKVKLSAKSPQDLAAACNAAASMLPERKG